MRCKSCGDEMPDPEPRVVVETKKESCRCGMTEATRTNRYIALVFVGAFICLLGCCVSYHHFSTRQVEIMSEQFEIRKKENPSAPLKALELPYSVEGKKK